MTDDELMQAALDEARSALARGEFPVGCVIADQSGILVRAGRRNSVGPRPSELAHAEMNALQRLEEISPLPEGKHLTLAVTLEPCLMCYGAILLAGIGSIVYAYEDAMGGGTGCLLERLGPLYATRRPRIKAGVRREEALALFQTFFANPAATYWQDSLLARYTLTRRPREGQQA
jgi:tRNA(adenine34) deaminase